MRLGMSWPRHLPHPLDQLLREIARFGLIGIACTFLDIAAFNVLHSGLGVGPLTSKALATGLASVLAYVGNRQWTFRHRARGGVWRQSVLFMVANGAALTIAEVCLGFTYYVLAARSPLATNISANIVGLGASTAFRFWAYRRWVFPRRPATEPEHSQALSPTRPAQLLAPASALTQ